MARFLKKTGSRELPALGKLGFVGTQRLEYPLIRVTSYSEDRIEVHENVSRESLRTFRDSPTPVWIDICGVHDTALITAIAESFDFHPAVIDKITNTGTRASFEDFGEYLAIALKMLKIREVPYEVEAEHIQSVLNRVGGHKGRTCDILGISRPALDRKITKYALEVPSR